MITQYSLIHCRPVERSRRADSKSLGDAETLVDSLLRATEPRRHLADSSMAKHTSRSTFRTAAIVRDEGKNSAKRQMQIKTVSGRRCDILASLT